MADHEGLNGPDRGSTDPEVSVVVAVLNASKTLPRCVKSVAEQQDVETQLLVIDGGSTDGTRQLLETGGLPIDHWESGPDGGVYSAWNKALPKATGRWVCFLGADDYLRSPTVFRQLVEAGEAGGAELVCSRVLYEASRAGHRRVVGQPWDWTKMTRFMCVAHPGLLHRRDLFERFGHFSEQYRIAGDYEFLLRLGAGTQAVFVDEPTVCTGASGLSADSSAMLREMRLVQSRHPQIGPRRASLNYGWCVFERVIWELKERLPFALPEHPALRVVGGALGLHRHDYQAGPDGGAGATRKESRP